MGQWDDLCKAKDCQVVVVSVRIVLIVGVDVGDSPFDATRIDGEQAVVSAGDSQQDRIDH